MLILKIAILTCVLAIQIALLASILCYTRLRLAEIKARRSNRPEHGDCQNDGGTKNPHEPVKPAPGSVDEGIENIMTYSVKVKTGESL